MRLIVVRHAKSSWSSPMLRDHDRPLSGRGTRSARNIGNWLAANGYIPRQVLCSSSRRTRETWSGIMQQVGQVDHVDILPQLYHAGREEMERVARMARFSPAMIIGHNPGIADFANWICREPPMHADFFRYPTGATLVCDMEGKEWRLSISASGAAVAFTIPRELE